MAYRDPLPSEGPNEFEPPYLDILGPERAAFYRQREDDEFATPRWLNTSAGVLRAELDVALFAKVDRLQATLERLADAISRYN